MHLSKNLMKYIKFNSQLTSESMMLWVDAQTRALAMGEGKSIEDVEFIPT